MYVIADGICNNPIFLSSLSKIQIRTKKNNNLKPY
jgi:hypothetical protein